MEMKSDNSRYDNNCNYGSDCCHDNRHEDPDTLPIITGDGPTVDMQMSSNQSEDDDDSGETRGSGLCCVMW